MSSQKKTKQELILETARDLFWKHGFKRVSVEEICERSGVSKMTFYRFFPNKIELAKTVFNAVSLKGVEDFRAILQENSPAEEKFHKMLMLKHEGTNQISQEFLTDFYTNKEPELQQYVQEKSAEMWQMIVADFEAAQEKGIFRKDFKPAFLLMLTQRLTDMFSDPQVLALYDSPQDLVMEVANLFMYGITPHR